MTKPIVFISHIAEEKKVAQALKELVESSFINMMDVFVSSDPRSVTLGQEWLQKIKFALTHCAVEIVIASPLSVKRQWVNFEAGAGWIREVPVIPLCHSGMTPAQLPAPLNTFQAATATDIEQLELILPVLADALGSGVPNVGFETFVEKVKAYESDSRHREKIRLQNPASEQDGLLPYEFETFAAIAELTDGPSEPVAIYRVREQVKHRVRHLGVSLALKMLERKELIILSLEPADFNETYYAAKISDPGWAWLQENQDRLDLTTSPEATVSKNPRPDEDETPF